MTGKSLAEPHGPRTRLGTVIFVRLFGDEGIDKAVRLALTRSKNWLVLLSSVRVSDRVFLGPRERVMLTLGGASECLHTIESDQN